MSTILLVEDNAELADVIRHNLEFEGYSVIVAPDGHSGLDAIRSRKADLVILDAMLPGIDGFQVLRTIRSEKILTPVMMLTALGDESNQVRALRLDADQYVTKPFKLTDVLERIAMMLRRTAALSQPATVNDQELRFGDVIVSSLSRKVSKNGKEITLTPRALDLLLAMAARPGVVLSRHELLRTVWQHQAAVVTRTVDSHISELRQKLEDDPDNPRYLVTVRKAGYRFDA